MLTGHGGKCLIQSHSGAIRALTLLVRTMIKNCLENMGKSHVKSFLISKNCKIDFFFNPPSASHFCGVFESQISTICKVLFGLLLKQSSSLSDECLSNLLHEVSAIINCLTLSHFNLFDLYNKPVCLN